MRTGLRWTFALALPAVLLVVLAVLQYRWIDEVSRVERERARIHLTEAAHRFAVDLSSQLAGLRESFRVPPATPRDAIEGLLRDRWVRFEEGGDDSGLARQLLVVWPEVGAAAPRVDRLDPSRGEFVEVPPDAAELPGLVKEAGAGPGVRLGRDLAVMVQPIRGPGPRDAGQAPLVVLQLDPGALFDQLLPDLAERWFGGQGGLDEEVALLDGAPPETRVVWTTNRAINWPSAAEIEVPVHPSAAFGHPGRRGPWAGQRVREASARHVARRGGGMFDTMTTGQWPSWTVAVAHRSGSLDAAVDAARTRNLAVASAVMALLAGAFVMSALATRRARRTARQQADFVAGVTHELKTPLAAIRSAGQNLADGVVSADPKVREYGGLVDREGRRLSEMVTELLELAGLQSGRREPVLSPVGVGEVVEGALEDCRWVLDESGVEVEVDLEAGLPPLLAERSAVRRALHNLIHNAATYGRSGGWIGVRAVAEPRRAEMGVCITVADRGPGIPRAEQVRVFEPFVRGDAAGAMRASGSGLGLAVVRHVARQHGGGVGLESDHSGTAVSLWLPAAEPGAAAEPVETRS